jgi:hypothetical protein
MPPIAIRYYRQHNVCLLLEPGALSNAGGRAGEKN